MFTRSKLTEQLCQLLRETNQDISYARIETETGKDLDKFRAALYNARRYLERDEGIVFAPVPGVGLRRLTDEEKLESSKTFNKTIRRTAIRGVTRVNAIQEPDKLTNADQLTLTIQRTIFEAVQRETGERG